MSLSSPFTGQRVFSPAIVGLIFFHFFANAGNKRQIMLTVHHPLGETSVQPSARGKIHEEAPSLPLQIFWEYGKVMVLLSVTFVI